MFRRERRHSRVVAPHLIQHSHCRPLSCCLTSICSPLLGHRRRPDLLCAAACCWHAGAVVRRFISMAACRLLSRRRCCEVACVDSVAFQHWRLRPARPVTPSSSTVRLFNIRDSDGRAAGLCCWSRVSCGRSTYRQALQYVSPAYHTVCLPCTPSLFSAFHCVNIAPPCCSFVGRDVMRATRSVSHTEISSQQTCSC